MEKSSNILRINIVKFAHKDFASEGKTVIVNLCINYAGRWKLGGPDVQTCDRIQIHLYESIPMPSWFENSHLLPIIGVEE